MQDNQLHANLTVEEAMKVATNLKLEKTTSKSDKEDMVSFFSFLLFFLDDRFILKEMSKLELQLFLDFANHYFNYIQKCQDSNQPTLLGKIVGVYTVSFRNTNTNSTLKCNLLVMENLFYKKNVSQKYDLKGSVRNRLVNPSLQGEGEIVYLDENLLQSEYC